MRIALTTLLAAAMLVASGCGTPRSLGGTSGETTRSTSAEGTTAQPKELTIAIAGMVTPDEGLAYYQDLSRYVGGKVGLPVRLFHKAEYAEVNDMLEQRKVDMAFVCSGPYVAGHDAFGLELLAAPQVNGAPVYYSYVIVPKDSPATSLEGLRGATFAFTDPQSNTGKLVPTYLVSRLDSTPEAFFGKVFYTYSHDNSIKAVATGQADGAAVDSLIFDYASANDPAFTSRTKVILKSDPFGIPPVVVHPDMDPVLKKRLRDAFLGAHRDPQGKAILAKMGVDRFIEIEDSAYDSIRQMNDWIARNK